MNIYAVFEHGDTVLIGTFLLLVAMSAVSWYILVWKLWKLRKERMLLRQFRQRYATAPDWPLHFEHISNSTAAAGRSAVGVLLEEAQRIAPLAAAHAETRRQQLYTTHLAQALDVVRIWLDKGLTLLASIGSSAPFIGLFGTVWGVYRALERVAVAGNARLDVVAGPMGEALVMTALGLFVAIPAVLAYNSFVRANRVLMQDLRHIAEQLALYPLSGSATQNIPATDVANTLKVMQSKGA